MPLPILSDTKEAIHNLETSSNQEVGESNLIWRRSHIIPRIRIGTSLHQSSSLEASKRSLTAWRQRFNLSIAILLLHSATVNSSEDQHSDDDTVLGSIT